MSGAEENKLFAQRFYDDLYNRGRLALAEELVTADFIDHTAPVGTPAVPSSRPGAAGHGAAAPAACATATARRSGLCSRRAVEGLDNGVEQGQEH